MRLFQKKPLSNYDFLFLILLLILVIIALYPDFHGFFASKPQNLEYQTILSISLYLLVCITPFSIRFSKLYFSLIWILILLNFYLSADSKLKLLPIIGFVYYNLIRIIHLYLHKREFIPMLISKSAPHYYFSKSQKRRADKTDFYYTYTTFFLGIVLLYAYVIYIK